MPNIIGPQDRNHPLVMLEQPQPAPLARVLAFPLTAQADCAHLYGQFGLVRVPERAVAFDHVCVATFGGHISTGSGVH